MKGVNMWERWEQYGRTCARAQGGSATVPKQQIRRMQRAVLTNGPRVASRFQIGYRCTTFCGMKGWGVMGGLRVEVVHACDGRCVCARL